MINTVNIRDVATFRGQYTFNNLKKFNYFFGANGTGKTTISRQLNAPDDYCCSIVWANQTPLEMRVYNRDFVEKNFGQQLPGVFTLGEIAKETLEKIGQAQQEIEKLQKEIGILNKTLQGADGNGGKQAELAKLNEDSKATFWKIKTKHDEALGGGMTGVRNSRDAFMQKVLAESVNNTAELLTQAVLEAKAKTVFSNTLVQVDSLPKINTSETLQYETNPILQKRIIGKDDVDIAAMIFKLGNSDWVRQGLSFYEANDGVCPFCQQTTNENLRKSLSEYFDETFTRDAEVIKTLMDNYSAETQRLQGQIQALIDSPSSFLDIERLKAEKQLLDSTIVNNKQLLEKKQKESSQVVSLNSLENVLTRIVELVMEANNKIAENNRIVENLKNEKTELTSQIWKFIVTELANDIEKYNQEKLKLDQAIESLNGQISTKNSEKGQKKSELQKLEKQTTSIVPTKDGINRLLSNFGFTSFKLDVVGETNTYKLVREDGSDAKDTLSDGERNFLTFLYFYHLLQGSQTETGMANHKVVVIDDPISSLDNDVLFIVCTLIRGLIADIRDNKSTIKQMFILTHNLYFHKEITYKNSSDATFWLVKKNGNTSLVENPKYNPIRTSYDILWEEVRSEKRNNATIQNTLRRILENYFKLLENIPLDKLDEKFDGDDKLKCKALCSWINDGSHSVFGEDFYTPLDQPAIQKFLEIFKQIFEKTGHIAHYNMMIREETIDRG